MAGGRHRKRMTFWTFGPGCKGVVGLVEMPSPLHNGLAVTRMVGLILAQVESFLRLNHQRRLASWRFVLAFVSPPIGQAFAFNAFQGFFGTLEIIDMTV